MTAPSDLPTLPEGWVWTKLGDTCDLINGRAFKPSEWSSEGLPIIRIQNLNNVNADFNYCDFEVEDKYLVNNGQLLFAWSGTPGTSFGAHIWNRGKAVLNQHIFKVEINEKHISKSFFMYQTNNNIDEYIRKAHGTAGLAHITKNKFENSLVAIHPLPEQHRIVAKIDELFTKQDAGVESLKNVKAQLRLYRQAVLKHAFKGKLTSEWRERHKDELEPASVLLERIKEERKKNAKGKYKELPPRETSDLPELPEEWVWTRLEEISQKITDGTHHTPTYTDYGVPFISVKDVFKGKISFENCKYISEEEHNNLIKRCNPEYLDVLITKSGTIGRTAVIKTNRPFSLFVSVALIKPYKKYIDSNSIAFSLENYINSIDIQQSVKGGVIKNLHIEDLKKIIIGLPPLSEQHKIVEEIERRFSLTDEVERSVNQSFEQAERLRQSILKTAFEGQLVPQDPSDEPASVLLEANKSREDKARRQ